MNRRAIFVVVCLVLIAAFSAAVLFKPQPQQPQKTATTGEKSVAAAEPIANQQALVRFHSPTFGPADAPVIIVEFFDPSCEACRAFSYRVSCHNRQPDRSSGVHQHDKLRM